MNHKINRCYLIISIAIMMPYMMISQGVHDQIWYLNDGYRINWTSGLPIVEQIGQTSRDVENVSTFTDADGSVVAYTEGLYLRNDEQDTIANSQGLLGSISSNNSAIIVPFSTQANKYHIFCSQYYLTAGIISHSVLDMSLNDGRGAIVPSKKNIEISRGKGEYLTIAKGTCNRLWIITRDQNYRRFYATELIDDVIGETIESVIDEENFEDILNPGSIKFNKDFKLMAYTNITDSIYLFHFDNSSGVISEYLNLSLEPQNNPSGGICFSSNDSLLYVLEGRTVREPDRIRVITELYQYNLSLGTHDNILDSKVLVGMPDVGVRNSSNMQMGLDNKIYITRRLRDYLGIIHEPNAVGIACNYEDDGLYMNGLLQRFARLPNLIVEADQVDIPQLDLVDSIVLCSYDTLSIELDTQRFDSLIWSDGYTGYDRKITDSGTYILSAYSQGCMEVDTINVSESEEISLPVDTVLCHSDSLVIDLSEYDDVVWSDGVTTAIRTINTAGLYGVSIIDETGCIVEESITIARAPRERSLLPTDTILCKGEQIKIISNESADTYLWSTGSTERFIEVLEGGVYTLDATYSDCTYRDSIIVYEMDCTPPQCHTYIPNGIHLSSRTGNNSFVVASNCAMIDYSLNIYDRWGNEMYQSRDENQGWDGSYGDSPAMSGVYLYQLHYRHSPDEPIQTATGTITLFR